MTEHHVGALRVNLRTHGAPTGDLQRHARTFAEHLLEAIAEKLEARARGKLVLVRRLPVTLRARPEMLLDRAEIDRIAEELARSITWREDLPAPDDDVVVFADEVTWHAALLETLAHGREIAWWFAELASRPDGAGGLTELPAETIAAVLAQVERADALVPLLERMPVRTLELLAEHLGIAIHAQASPRPDGTVGIAVTRELAASIRVRGDIRASQPASTAAIEPTAHEPTSATSGRDLTCFGGLVYLVRCLLELDAGEILWRACLPEPHVIAAALAMFVDAHDDPGPALLGGPSRVFDASPDQRTEIAAALCASLHRALPRRGLASPIEVSLRFVDGPRGRILYALVDAWPIFAAPAPTPSHAKAAIEAFLGIWQGPVNAPPAIAELAERVVGHTSDDATPPPLRDDLSGDAALIVAMTAGCAAALFFARAGALDFAARARIHDEGDARIVSMAGDAIRIAVRRAGLDSDPGWVPWLERHVRIVFDEATGP